VKTFERRGLGDVEKKSSFLNPVERSASGSRQTGKKKVKTQLKEGEKNQIKKKRRH